MHTQICTKCKNEKTFAEFHRKKIAKNGIREICKECRKIEYLKPKEQVDAWNIRRKERMHIMGKSSAGRSVSIETINKFKKSQQEYYKRIKLDKSISAFNRIYSRYYRKGCRISKDEFKIFIKNNCYYCGSEPKQTSKTYENGIFIYNGLDRVDNLKGYDLNNVVTCCQSCNRAKLQMTLNEFKYWVKMIYLNLQKKGLI